MNGEPIASFEPDGTGSSGSAEGPKRRALSEQLEELCLISGVSGFEGEAARAVLESFKGLYDESRIDTLGNCIMVKKGEVSKDRGPRTGVEAIAHRNDPSPVKVMLAAHMDEVGLVVTKVEKGGFLRFTCIGRIDPRVLPGAEVVVFGKRKVLGVIGSVPLHLRERQESGEEGQAVGFDDLYVDTSLSDDKLEEVVRVGDPVRFASTCVRLGGNRLAGRALDDRAGLLAVRVCLECLTRSKHEADVFAVATTGEEIGLKGATVAAYGVHPDVAIAVDVTFGLEPGVAEHEGSKLGGGPVIGLGPNVHPEIARALLCTCDELGIPHQVEVIPGPSGTDAWAIQISREGVPTALVSIPVRCMHTPSEEVDLRDVEWTGRLLAEFISRLNPEFLKETLEIRL